MCGEFKEFEDSFNKSLDKELPFSDDNETVYYEQPLKKMGYTSVSLSSAALVERSLFRMIKRTIVNKKEPDFTVQIGKTLFKNCHIILLHYYSDFFKKFKRLETVSLSATIVTPKGFQYLYNWMLSTEKVLTRFNLIDAYVAADYLCIPKFIEHCKLYFIEEYHEENAFILFLKCKNFPQTNSILSLKKMLLETIEKSFLTIVASSDFQLLSAEEICQLLHSPHIAVNSELEVFMSAVRWLNFDWHLRKKYTVQLMHCIKFPIMPIEFLINLRNRNVCFEVKRLLENSSVQNQIASVVLYKFDQMKKVRKYKTKQEQYELTEAFAPASRLWVFDVECTHHTLLPNSSTFTYKEFLHYLNNFRYRELYHWQYTLGKIHGLNKIRDYAKLFK